MVRCGLFFVRKEPAADERFASIGIAPIGIASISEYQRATKINDDEPRASVGDAWVGSVHAEGGGEGVEVVLLVAEDLA